MKTTITMTFAFALIAAPLFGGNDSNYTYLALGDSVAFGFDPLLLPPYATQLPTPDKFVGYPEVVAIMENLVQSKKEVNASCPGETSGSFLNVNTLDNGCNSPHAAPAGPPFKTTIGLHTAYTGAQMDFAESQLKANKHISLVTLDIGANDFLLILPQLEQCGTDTTCLQNLMTPILQTFGGNLAQILTRIRALYQGTLILVKYYSPSPALDSLTMEVNNVMTQVVAQLSAQPHFAAVQFADVFTVFQVVSAPFNHDACQAGLVIRLPLSPPTPTPCDIHPTPLGRDLIAGTIEFAKIGKH